MLNYKLKVSVYVILSATKNLAFKKEMLHSVQHDIIVRSNSLFVVH